MEDSLNRKKVEKSSDAEHIIKEFVIVSRDKFVKYLLNIEVDNY